MTIETPSIILFFGVAGAGKSFAGRALSDVLGYHHYELDQDLTVAMRQAIDERRAFTDEMRDEFFHTVVLRMKELVKSHPRIVFTQGAYKERHRRFLKEQIPGLQTIWVTAPPDSIINRLVSRGDKISPEYATMIARNFETPSEGLVLHNDDCSPQECCARFTALFR